MGADYYHGIFYGAYLKDLVCIREEVITKTKYDEDTGKPYEIKETKTVWYMGDQTWVEEGSKYDMVVKVADYLGLEVSGDSREYRSDYYMLGINLTSGDMESSSRTSIDPNELLVAINKVNSIIPNAHPILVSMGWALC